MKTIPLDGALDGLRVADISDLGNYKRAVADGRQIGFGYYFPYILTYNRPGRSAALVVEDEGSICMFRWRMRDAGPRIDVLIAPAPMSPTVLRRCLERANDFNGDKSAKVLKIDAKDIDLCASLPDLRVTARKTQYLYSPQAFGKLAGSKYRTLRRNVAKVQDLDALEVHPYLPGYREACLELLQKWRGHHQSRHGTRGGVGGTRRIIDMADTLEKPDMFGEVIEVAGRLVAFAFGGEIRPGCAAFVEAKCDLEIPGLSYYQRYCFMSKLESYHLLNDGPDVGREGLAQLKKSLRPVGMHTEYRAMQEGE